MNNTITTIRRTQDLIERFSKCGDPEKGWRHFQRTFGKNASSKYSCARIAARIKEFDPVAAQKGYIIDNGQACALWLCPATRINVFPDGTSASASAMSKRPGLNPRTRSNRDGFWMFTRHNGENVVYC